MHPSANSSAPSTSALKLRLFGSFEAQSDDAALPPTRTRKELCLLALLILRHPQPLERSWLAGMLWPDSAEDRALYYLRRSLHNLRRVLGVHAFRLLAPTPRMVALDLSGAEVDLLKFDQEIAQGDAVALQHALTLYRGPLLAAWDEEWILPERTAREQAYLAALEQLAQDALTRNQPAEALRLLRLAEAVDPLRESALCALLRALSAAGDYAGLMHAYRAFRLRVHQHLQTEPAAATTALYHQLRLLAHSRLEPPRPLAEETADAAPRLNLPQPVSALIGREAEIDQLLSELQRARLLTLTGPGGVGKTRLAIAVAEAAADDYRDGVYFVDLAPLSEAGLMPQAVATALGVREEPQQPLRHTLQQWLAAKSLLLVLDNCEHLLSACASLAHALLRACSSLSLLATSRQPLGVSGERVWRAPALPTPRASEFASRPGETFPAKEAVPELLEYAAVQLFVERAAWSERSFHLTPQNAAAVAQICERLEGLPLALELAAGRIRALTAEQIASRLDDRFRLLRGGSRTAQPRQQTLEATLDWSYELLTEPEQRLLRSLSVFAGGFTLEAAEFICVADEGIRVFRSSGVQEKPKPTVGNETQPRAESDASKPKYLNTRTPEHLNADEVLDLLSSLIDQSLVMFDGRNERGEGRYFLLETIRQYSRQRLEAVGEVASLRDRHLAYFLALAEASESQLRGSEQAIWLARMEAEIDNLRAALEWSLESRGGEGEKGRRGDGVDSSSLKSQVSSLSLAGALWRFWWTRGYWSEGRACLAEALERTGTVGRTLERAGALQGAGNLAWKQGDFEAARALFEQSLAIKRELGDKKGMAASLNGLGGVALEQGDYPAAKALFDECLALNREIGNKPGIASALSNLGNVHRDQGDFEAARALLEQSLEIEQERGDRQGIASSLMNLGLVAQRQDNYPAARALFEQSLAIRRELGDIQGITTSLDNLGSVIRAQGDFSAARLLFEESLALGREIGDKGGIAYSLYHLGTAAHDAGDYEQARAFLKESLTLNRELGIKQGISYALNSLGSVTRDQGDFETARSLFEESLALGREMGDKGGIAYSLYHLGTAAHDQGDYEQARALLEQSLAIQQELADKQEIAALFEAFVHLAVVEGQPERAVRLWGAAEALREAMGSHLPPNSRMKVDIDLAAVRETLGEEAFTALRAEGRAMPWEQAVEFALKAGERGKGKGKRI